MAKVYRHIFLNDSHRVEEYKPPPKGVPQKSFPTRDRASHSVKLKKEWIAIWEKAKEKAEDRAAVSKTTKDGVYIEFEGAPGFELQTKSLEDRQVGIRLLNIYKVPSQDSSKTEITRATVFIPFGKQNRFLKKINEFAEKDTKTGKPKNESLIRSIEDIRIAILESFWRDPIDLIPDKHTAVWCEIWLSGTGENLKEEFKTHTSSIGIETQPNMLTFPERTVLLGKTTKGQLQELLEVRPDIAEFRRAKETAEFFIELSNKEQTEWAEELKSRLDIVADTKVAVAILDTGANHGHLLLTPLLSDDACHTLNESWGKNDHDGHGTLMCGVAAYGDLLEALRKRTPIKVSHSLESVKILPPKGDNDPALYGDLTIQSISRVEIQAPEKIHIGCMAVTSNDDRDNGRPSSWSAAIDQLTSGYDDDNKRLFIVSAGNISDTLDWSRYPESNKEHSVEDPGQSWNAVTVGAYTEKVHITDSNLKDHTPIAQAGQLSPFSSTSKKWESKWPIKPEIVLEGGNLIKSQDDDIFNCEDLSILSTCHRPIQSQFGIINATSAATAQAGWLAAQIQSHYQGIWPETVRGLIIHSAQWTEALKQQFMTANDTNKYNKTEYKKLLRICGYGVPNLNDAINSAANTLTLISQTELQPYWKDPNKSVVSTKDMHLYRLPWPENLLLSLGEIPVRLRITLSYFIEPGPGEVGWKDRYRYASYALRFDLNAPNENENDFRYRLNAAVREEGEQTKGNSGSDRWLLGANNRNIGSIHSDIWEGTAAEISTCNLIGVYPVTGWWKERHWLDRWNKKTRYTLIASLHTPEESQDIYTPVAIQLGIPIEVSV